MEGFFFITIILPKRWLDTLILLPNSSKLLPMLGEPLQVSVSTQPAVIMRDP